MLALLFLCQQLISKKSASHITLNAFVRKFLINNAMQAAYLRWKFPILFTTIKRTRDLIENGHPRRRHSENGHTQPSSLSARKC